MIQLYPPLFINVEYSRSFVQEYPVCSVQKNIIAPYPILDPDLYSAKYFRKNVARKSLLFYQGGNHGSCVQVRMALMGINAQKTYVVSKRRNKREEGFLSATFCPIPIGDSPSSKRMYDVLNVRNQPAVALSSSLLKFNH